MTWTKLGSRSGMLATWRNCMEESHIDDVLLHVLTCLCMDPGQRW